MSTGCFYVRFQGPIFRDWFSVSCAGSSVVHSRLWLSLYWLWFGMELYVFLGFFLQCWSVLRIIGLLFASLRWKGLNWSALLLALLCGSSGDNEGIETCGKKMVKEIDLTAHNFCLMYFKQRMWETKWHHTFSCCFWAPWWTSRYMGQSQGLAVTLNQRSYH